MRSIKDLDRILRGEATRLVQLRSGAIDISARGLSFVILILGMFYGLCMGSFAVLSGNSGMWKQMISSMCKVPALFFFTLVVTFPSLYVFNALVGSRLSLLSVLRLLVSALGVILALLASFGTIVAFFSFTTSSHPFIVLLNVVIFASAGMFGLRFLMQTLHRLTIVQDWEPPVLPVATPEAPASDAAETTVATEPATAMADGTTDGRADAVAQPAQRLFDSPQKRSPSALQPITDRPPGANVVHVFRVWIVVFGLVGTQMSWVLRPFIGSAREFQWFGAREGNFFDAVYRMAMQLMGA